MGCETKKDIKELARLKIELAKDPNNVDLLFKIGMLLFDPFIDMDKGRAYFEKAIELEPDNPNLLFWFGYALYHNECDYKAAKKLFERALSLDPDRAEFHYMMFNVLWQTSYNRDVDFNYLLNAIELQPEWLSPRKKYISCLIMKNELNKAEKELSEAYVVLDKRYKNKKISNPNILESYYLVDGALYGSYKFEKESLDSKKQKLEEKQIKYRQKN